MSLAPTLYRGDYRMNESEYRRAFDKLVHMFMLVHIPHAEAERMAHNILNGGE
jgi:hypothetical protein